MKFTRRTLLGAACAAVSPGLFAQRSALTLHKLHNCELRVADVARSVDFYQRLFGMPVQARSGDRVSLRIGAGPQFMSVRPLRDGESPAIVHLGYSVEGYTAATAVDALERVGFAAIEAPLESARGIDHAMSVWTRTAGAQTEVYFADARGLIVQLSAPQYCGAGAMACEAEQSAEPGVFELTELNHFTVFLGDGAGANRFYQETFGLSVQAYQGPMAPVTGIGDGYQFVMYAGPPGSEGQPANIHHGCFSMRNFDEARILSVLNEQGLRPRGDGQAGPLVHYVSRRMPERGGAEGGTPEVYFTDPDGILMQLQDVSYCGGGGYFGELCLDD